MPTLEEIERDAWDEPGPDATYLVRTCCALRRKPLDALTVEDLRILIGQRIGVAHVLPLAVAVLLTDPTAEGDYYPGDLLAAVMGLPDADWQHHDHLREDLRRRLQERPLVFDDEDHDHDQRMQDQVRLWLS